MEKYKLEANEAFFEKVISFLKDGGSYCYPAVGCIYTKTGGILTGNKEAMDNVKPIVSEEFFNTHFKETV
jgi:hypothetical protein